LPASDPKPTVGEYNAFVLKYAWRNFALNVLDGGVYAIGVVLVQPETVLSGFISDCISGAPGLEPHKNTLVGLMTLIIMACFMMPQQLWAAKLTEGRPLLKKPLIILAFIERMPWLLMGMMTALVAGKSPVLALYLFLAIIFSYHSIIGIVSPVWQELVAKVTPVQRRGLLFGVRESLGGVLGFGALTVVNHFLPKLAFPSSYTLIFFATFGFMFISAMPLFFLKEPAYPIERRERTMREYLRDVADIVRSDKSFRRYFWCRALLSLSQIAAAPLFAIRAIEVLGARAPVVLMVEMTMVITLSRVVFSILIGPLGDWFGYRVIMGFSAIAAAGSIVFALVASTPPGFYVAYALSTFFALAFWLGHSNYILELAPLEKRPSYISLDNMSGLPFFAAPIIGGWLADKVGYTAPFVIGAFFAAAAAAGFFSVVAEPRKSLRTDLVS